MTDEEKSRGSNKERQKALKEIEFREYHSDLVTNKKDKKTPTTYRETFILLEEWMEEQAGIDSWHDLETSHLSFFNKYLQEERELWGRTIDGHMNRLSTFFKDKDRDDLADKIQGFEKTNQNLYQKKTGEEVLFVDIHQYAKILDACEKNIEELIIRCLWETGLRRSELSETTIQKIDRDKQVFNVDNKKNEKTRKVPYSAELKPILREWLDYGGRSKYSTAQESEHLIINQHATQVQPSYINDIVRRVADRTDVSYSYAEDAKGRKQWFPTAHHFRHSYATYRVANGMDLKTLSKLMGHKGGVEQTAKYVGILEDGLREDNEKYRPKTRTASQDLAENL